MAAGVPFAWVAADSIYGVGEIEMALRRAGKGYVLGVNATQPFNSWVGKPEIAGTAERIAQGLAASAWRRLSAGEGTKGPRLSDWAPTLSWPTSARANTGAARPASGRAAC